MDLKPVIIIAGLPSVGSTTIAKRLAGALDLKYIYVGKIFRQMCVESGYCPEDSLDTPEFEKFYKQFIIEKLNNDPNIDLEVDQKIVNIIKETTTPTIVEGRTIAALVTKENIPVVLKIWITSSLDIRAQRFLLKHPEYKKDLEEVKRTLIQRDKLDRERYLKLYGIDIFKPEDFNDIVIDTSHLDVDQTYFELTSHPVFRDKIRLLFDFYPEYDIVYRWKCLVCNYTYEGFKPVHICPRCGNIDPAKFKDLPV